MVYKISQFKKQAAVIEMLKMWTEKTLWIMGTVAIRMTKKQLNLKGPKGREGSRKWKYINFSGPGDQRFLAPAKFLPYGGL